MLESQASVPGSQGGIIGGHEDRGAVSLLFQLCEHEADQNAAKPHALAMLGDNQVFQLVVDHQGEPQNRTTELDTQGCIEVTVMPHVDEILQITAAETLGH